MLIPFLSFPAAAADTGYLTELQERAQRMGLAGRDGWRALVHYEPLLLSKGMVSQVDAESFFAAPNGKHDPAAELDATLASFFVFDESDQEKSGQCRYPARYHWLKQELGFDPARLRELPCPRFGRLVEQLDPHRLTLIFPAAYMNNPASMFGHTLLRVDARNQNEQTRLLAHTINFAADTDQERGVPFAFKGLFGGYQGRFSIAPYYVKVRTYGDIENRDIWEYGLNLTPSEITQMLRHYWEMRSAWFDYYFVDENCSYHLLSLLETARPGLRLTERFAWWAIPSETVRAVVDAGLVEDAHFRPARTTVLEARARLLDHELRVAAKRLAEGDLKPGAEEMLEPAPEEQARTIELAVDYAAYLRSPRAGSSEPDERVVLDLLRRRSSLDVPDQTPVVPRPEVRPDEGHKSARAAIGYGYEDRRHYVELSMSPGYHGIFDPPGGYTRGAQIRVLDTAVRYYPEEGSVELERLDVIDILSLSPRTIFLRPFSWKAGAGLGRKHADVAERLLVGRAYGGVGVSYDLQGQTSVHAFAEGTVELSDRYDYALAGGIGPGFGVIHDFSRRWRTGLTFRWQRFFSGDWRSDYEAALIQRIYLDGQSAVGLDLTWKKEFDHGYGGAKLFWQLYF